MSVRSLAADLDVLEPVHAEAQLTQDEQAPALAHDLTRVSGGIPRDTMISPEQVAKALADLVEQPTVPLRVPVGALAERVIAARNTAPYDKPFVRA